MEIMKKEPEDYIEFDRDAQDANSGVHARVSQYRYLFIVNMRKIMYGRAIHSA